MEEKNKLNAKIFHIFSALSTNGVIKRMKIRGLKHRVEYLKWAEYRHIVAHYLLRQYELIIFILFS